MSRHLLLLVGLFASQPAHAAGNDLERAAGVAAGIYAGIYVHELGHASAYYAAGATDIRIRVPGTQCALLCGSTHALLPATPSPAAARFESAVGFMSSNLASELLLRNESGARSAFGQGFVATNLYSNVAHVVTYYTKVRGRNGYRGNDIDAYEMAGGNPHLLSAALVGYSVVALRRMHKNNIPFLFMRVGF